MSVGDTLGTVRATTGLLWAGEGSDLLPFGTLGGRSTDAAWAPLLPCKEWVVECDHGGAVEGRCSSKGQSPSHPVNQQTMGNHQKVSMDYPWRYTPLLRHGVKITTPSVKI